MKNRRIIREDFNNPGAQQFTDPTLKKAFAAGCWPATVTGPMKDKLNPGAEAIYQFSKKPENAANPHVFDKPDGTREWRTTADENAKVARTSKWFCEKLEQSKNAELTTDQNQAMKTLIDYSKGQIVPYEEGVVKPASEGWSLKTLSELLALNLGGDYANLIGDALKTNKGTARVWILQGAKQYKSNLSNPVVKKFQADGWKTKEEVIETNGNLVGFESIDLSDCSVNPDTCKDFQGSYLLFKDTEIVADADVIKKLEEAITKSKSGDEKTRKVACKNALEFYARAYESKLEMSQPKINSLKPAIRNCVNTYPKFAKIVEAIQFASPTQTQTGRVADYSLNVNTGKTVQREHKEQLLKNLIRESLLEVKETKKKTILAENKIVNTRLAFISENVTLKTKKQKEKYFGELLSEMVYLNSQGFDKGVINEGLWDMLKGLFGNGADSVMQYFKEYIAKWLIGNLTPMDPNGWIGGTIVKAIGNLPIGDIPKLTDCNFLTALLSKSIAEEALDQVKNKAGMEGPFYDILRNAIVESLEDTSFGSKIENGLGSVICPLLGGITSKMGSAAETLKQNALSAS